MYFVKLGDCLIDNDVVKFLIISMYQRYHFQPICLIKDVNGVDFGNGVMNRKQIVVRLYNAVYS